MSSPADALKEAEKVAKSIPLLDKLEIDKLFAFLRILFLEPLTGITMIIAFGSGIQHANNTNDISLIMLIVSFYIFTMVILKRSDTIVKMAKIQNETKLVEDESVKNHKRQTDKINMVMEVMYTRENLRVEWIKGWSKILIDEMNMHKEYYNIIMDKEMPSDQKIAFITVILEKQEITRLKYEDIFKHIESPISTFQIGMTKPPDVPDQTILKEYERLLAGIDEIVSTDYEIEEESTEDI